MSLPLTRAQAIELLKKYNSSEKDPASWNHFLESEAIMRGVARELGGDEDEWGMLGLLHDVDWDSPKIMLLIT